jgi:hypothetical protein
LTCELAAVHGAKDEFSVHIVKRGRGDERHAQESRGNNALGGQVVGDCGDETAATRGPGCQADRTKAEDAIKPSL